MRIAFALVVLLALAALFGGALVALCPREVSSTSVGAQLAGGSKVPPLSAPVTPERHESAPAPDLEPTDPPVENASATKPISVIVVDGAGRPVSDVVVIVRHVEEDSEIAYARTDAAGRASVMLDAGWITDTDPLTIGTAWVTSTPARVEFTSATVSADPVRLVIAPSGSIELVFVGGEDHPVDEDADCSLSVDDERCTAPDSARMNTTRALVDLNGRTVRFGHVGLGLCFEARGSLRTVNHADVEFEGPRTAGELVRIELPFEFALTRFVGRLLETTGAPLPNRDVEISSIHAPGEPAMSRLLCDPTTAKDGPFVTHVYPDSARRAGPRLELRTVQRGELVRSGIVWWPESTHASASLEGATVDLGDVTVASEPLLAAGRVLDVRGQELDRWLDVGFQLRSLIPDYGDHWSKVDGRTARDGSFQIGLARPVERFLLRAISFSRAPSAPVEAARGALNLVLTLQPAAPIKGRVVVPDGISVYDLDFAIRLVDSPQGRSSNYETMDDGRFESRPLPLGRYSVTVGLDSLDLVQLEADVLDTGESTDVGTIDLREVLHVLRVNVVAEGTHDLAEGHAAVIVGEEPAFRASVKRDGTVILASAAKTADVIVSLPGHRTTRYDGVTSGATLRLEQVIRSRSASGYGGTESGSPPPISLRRQEGVRAAASEIGGGEPDSVPPVPLRRTRWRPYPSAERDGDARGRRP